MSEKRELSLQECYILSEQLNIVEANTLRCVGDPAWQYLLRTPAAYAYKEKELKRLAELHLIHKTENGYALSVSQTTMETIWEAVENEPETAMISQIAYPILEACIAENCAPDVFVTSALLPDAAKDYIAEQYAIYEKTGATPQPFLRVKDKAYTDKFLLEMRCGVLRAYDFDTREAFVHAAEQELTALKNAPCCPHNVIELAEEACTYIAQMTWKQIQEWKQVLNFNPGYI